ncbi:oxidized low-density lipoprotein receptor 1-like [Scyliorhinus canicula]|uniref:oxidized low-density lipoprotein receptor 1-like n=1 Tax=Scyliorhinus canicula TaxID=7830 RepID=UPI0018F4946A|nr:oxidized low-density lipoprotein receptor 1-like [Scyliorhinus canicula]
MRNISKDTTPRPVALDDYELTYSEMNFAARAQKSEIRPTAEPETIYAQVSFKPKSPQQNQVPEVTPDKDQSRHETAGGRCSGTSTHLGLVALIALISLFVIIIGLIVYVLLLNQKSDASQNDQASERQCADLLNRLLSESVRNQTNLGGILQNLSVAFAQANDTANSLCNTFRNVSVLLVNQMLDAFQNDQAIERQRADLLNRTLSESMQNQTNLEGKIQNLSAAFAQRNKTANSLCSTFRNVAESLCPRGWEAHNQKCYNFSADERNWNNAKQQCESHNSHLIIINTREEEVRMMPASVSTE